MTRTTDLNIYGEVSSVQDLRDINMQIRREMGAVQASSQLAELKKRSDYLCALTAAPSWRQKFGRRISLFMKAAKEEAERTATRANRVARRHGWAANYDPWGR